MAHYLVLNKAGGLAAKRAALATGFCPPDLAGGSVRLESWEGSAWLLVALSPEMPCLGRAAELLRACSADDA